ncbi:hypothetical protein [aff. Roholtiella sp. LEGE 12411]|uniref:hypothetical protein n=1 Tax=aff. Roholtiella sp. LEGE 12411 TaxID=1828822 RepID=UPI00187FB736|nr:hypothetical protein [aff. Roholtiella sp. LEGE 12411]MBE9037005.1 hypothetical protein [aff. Roholtiella sp. LEGE 12411]
MIFGRKASTDNKLAQIMEATGWGILAYNGLTLFPYFYKVLSQAGWIQQIIGSGTAVILILGIEAAAISVLFNPKVLLSAVERPRNLLNSPDPIVKNVSGVASLTGIIGFCLLAAYVFWFDYNVNLEQMGVTYKKAAQFFQILATSFVLGSEVSFGCSNIFDAATEPSTQANNR